MIIVQLSGGLGNQMFQYATARRIAHVNNALLKLDTSWFDTASPDTKRKYELQVFNIMGTLASLKEVNKLRDVVVYGPSSFRYRILKKFFTNHKRSHIREKHFHFDPDVLKLKDNIYLEGYWQSENYFHDIRAILIKEFSIKSDPNPINKYMSDEIRSSESVSVHVRRGDYVSNPVTNQYHGTCTLEYYQTAIDIVTRKIEAPRFFIFSDEPEWVKENLRPTYPATYIDFNGTDISHEDLRLMSLCKHHIIANSSFSWWGAWLSCYPGKLVIAPSKWFNTTSINTIDLIPDGWIRI